ncbi:MAG: hypothetical protein MIN69_15165 [Methylorubrum extorquens]|jgi:hypothetical protein|uniref:hypothetical protein n=1 Tax=Methylorubrum extorquens TaxID=408 RepID=UPI002FEE1B88
MSDNNMNVAIGLTVDTSGEELIDRLNRKVKQLQASLRRQHESDTNDYGRAAVQTLAKGQESERRKSVKLETQLQFARGRIKAIRACIERECGRCHDIERGREILAVLLPYVFEWYVLDDDSDFDHARRFVRDLLPGVMSDLGADGYGREWDRLAEERSVAEASQHANPKHRGKAVYWLPKVEEITNLFLLTRADRDALNERQKRHGGKSVIIGIPAIDPLSEDEKKAKDRERKTISNRSNGVRAQSERAIDKTLKAIAQRGGPKIATLYRHKAKDELIPYLDRKGIVLTESERKMIENFPRHNTTI